MKEDSVVDLRHLSFSDWLASVDPSLAVQQYLPCIQESYDTVAQRLGGSRGGWQLRIASTYTVVKGGQEKLLDPQLFEDFGIANEERFEGL